jgi:Protein of unknown function (DUF1761)
MEMNYLAIVVAVVVAFVASTVWYIVFGAERERLLGTEGAASERPPVWMVLVELVRSFVVAYVVAVLFGFVGVVGFIGAIGLGLLMWVGFPFVLLVGSVVWDRVPWKLAAIHAGDWLVKLLLISVIVGLWR